MERIICLVIGYVCGLFQTGYIIGKVHKTDIRDHGSGNAGTTNAFRTFGKKAGAITLLGDCLKCVLAIVIVRMVYGNSMNGILPLLTLYAAQFSDFYGISRWKGNCCFCRHDHCF